MRQALSTALAILAVASLAGCGSSPTVPVKTAAEQMDFGVAMARRGLWDEAMFRFQRAAVERPHDYTVMNNLAVASEARGRFEEALGYYERALELAPGNRDIRHNHDRFISFYDAYRARSVQGEAGESGSELEVSGGARGNDDGG